MLEDPDQIDMFFERDSRLVLIIVDAGITEDPDEHAAAVADKLDSYAAFLGSSEFARQSKTRPEDALIQITCPTPPKPDTYPQSVEVDCGGRKFVVPVVTEVIPSPF